MTTWITLAALLLVSTITAVAANPSSMQATEKTSAGDLLIDPINHSALHFEFGGKQFYVDPAGTANWSSMPRPMPSSSPTNIATILTHRSSAPSRSPMP